MLIDTGTTGTQRDTKGYGEIQAYIQAEYRLSTGEISQKYTPGERARVGSKG